MANRQEIEFIELIINDDIDEKEKIEQLCKIFYYTSPQFTEEDFLSIKEIEILTYIANTMNRVLEKIIIIEKILESEKIGNVLIVMQD